MINKPSRDEQLYAETYLYKNKEDIEVEKPRSNWEIKLPQITLIDENGHFCGLVSTKDAIQKARDVGLDLIEINQNSKPSLCKIMNLGKFLFEKKKKKKENVHKSPPTHEIRLTPNTEDHDLEIKAKKAIEFLKEGSKVTIQFKTKGREAKMYSQIKNVAERFTKFIENYSTLEFKDNTYIFHPKSS